MNNFLFTNLVTKKILKAQLNLYRVYSNLNLRLGVEMQVQNAYDVQAVNSRFLQRADLDNGFREFGDIFAFEEAGSACEALLFKSIPISRVQEVVLAPVLDYADGVITGVHDASRVFLEKELERAAQVQLDCDPGAEITENLDTGSDVAHDENFEELVDGEITGPRGEAARALGVVGIAIPEDGVDHVRGPGRRGVQGCHHHDHRRDGRALQTAILRWEHRLLYVNVARHHAQIFVEALEARLQVDL